MTAILENALIVVGTMNFSGNDNNVAFEISREKLDATAMGHTAKGSRLGLSDFRCGAKIFIDVSDNANDEVLFNDLNLRSALPFTVAVDGALGSIAYSGVCYAAEYKIGGDVGTMFQADLSFINAESYVFGRGFLSFNGSQSPGTSLGTAYPLGKIAINKKLLSNLHVITTPGSGTLDVTVEGGTDATFTKGVGYVSLDTDISASSDLRAMVYISGVLAVARSDNGVSYATITTLNSGSPYPYQWAKSDSGIGNPVYGLSYLNGAAQPYVCVGGLGSIYSNSALTAAWTARTSGTASLITMVYRSLVDPLGRSLAVGISDGGFGYIAYSSDNVSWTRASTGVPNESFYGAVDNGTTIIVVGTNRKILKSTNYTSWAAATGSGGGAETLRSIGHSSGTWIAVGDNGIILRSTDGDNFTSGFLPSGAVLYSVIPFGGGLWAISGNNGVYLYSNNDGVSFSEYNDNSGTINYNLINLDSERAVMSGSLGKIKITVGKEKLITHTQVATTAISEQKSANGPQPFSHYRSRNIAVTGTYSLILSIYGGI